MYKYIAFGLLVAAVSAIPTPEQQNLDCFSQDIDILSCFGVKAINTINRAARSADLKIIDGVKLVRETPMDRTARALTSETEMLSELPRELPDRAVSIIGKLYESIVSFAKSHSVEFDGPVEGVARSLEGIFDLPGKKLKKMNPLMAAFGFKALALIPLFIGGLVLLTVKALFVGKIALLIAGILAYQKFFASGANVLSGNGIGSFLGKAPLFDSGSQQNYAAANSQSTGYYRSLNNRIDAAQIAYAGQQPEVTQNESH